MKKSFALLIILVSSVFASTAKADNVTTVYISNLTESISDEELADKLFAFQFAADQFSKYWHMKVRLTLDQQKGEWPIFLVDREGPCSVLGCVVGFHDVDRYSNPYGIIYAAQMLPGFKWEEVLTHELFEMMVNPIVTRTTKIMHRDWLMEISDPVVGLEYYIPSTSGAMVPIANFVTPAWYSKKGKWPYDLMGKLHKPLTLTRHGYANYRSFLGWRTVVGPGLITDKVDTP